MKIQYDECLMVRLSLDELKSVLSDKIEEIFGFRAMMVMKVTDVDLSAKDLVIYLEHTEEHDEFDDVPATDFWDAYGYYAPGVDILDEELLREP